MRFPRPINDQKFNNEYDVILFTLSILLDRFEKEDQLFAPQCIWWLASLLQFMEILIYYWRYKVFLSDNMDNLEVTLLFSTTVIDPIVADSDIPYLDIATETKGNTSEDIRVLCPTQENIIAQYRISKRPTMLKSLDSTNRVLLERCPNCSRKENKHIQK